MLESSVMTNSNERVAIAKKVTWVGFFVNLLLTVMKIVAGVVANSTAMIADGVHSLSDFITDLIVIAFVGISAKGCDPQHRYGHGKYETFATLLISGALILVGLGIFRSSTERIYVVVRGEVLEEPGILAFMAALLSIVSKEILYQYTVFYGKKIESDAVIANAWHHRSDAFSSMATAIGIGGAIFLGEHWRVLDPIAGLFVSLLILKVAFDLGKPSVHELLDSSLAPEVQQRIVELIRSETQIKAYHHLRTRKVGNTKVIDMHIKLDRNISFVESHDIATRMENKLKKEFGVHTYTNIHTEPFDPNKPISDI